MLFQKQKLRLQQLIGFRRYLTLFLLGGLMTLSLQPVGFFPALFISVPAFIFMAQAIPSPGRSFLAGWAFGAGYFIFGLYWISAALFVDFDQWKWVLPLSLIAGPGLLGIFYGLIPLLSYKWRENAIPHALIFIIAWSVIEYIRGHILTGFPWSLPGYSWDALPPLMQFSSLAGIYGLTALTLFWAAIPALLTCTTTTAVSAATLFLVFSFGVCRLNGTPTIPTDHIIRIVQPNIAQETKWDPDEDWRNLQKHLDLTSQTHKGPAPRFVVWPETAVTADLASFPEIGRYISMSLPVDSLGILGSMRIRLDKMGLPSLFYNSAVLIDKNAEIIDTYDKHHLVPFGEYIPFRKELSLTPVAMAISGLGDFTPGTGIRTLRSDGLPAFSPLICYEVIFPGAVARDDDRPDWLVNITNDAWYGRSSGPYQHLSISRMRAIEEGLPLVRAANTGISAMIDPVGRILDRQSLNTAGVIDHPLPHKLPPTLYARAGDTGFFMLLIGFMAMAVYNRSSKKIT